MGQATHRLPVCFERAEARCYERRHAGTGEVGTRTIPSDGRSARPHFLKRSVGALTAAAGNREIERGRALYLRRRRARCPSLCFF